jgi:hypothetical protein
MLPKITPASIAQATKSGQIKIPFFPLPLENNREIPFFMLPQ